MALQDNLKSTILKPKNIIDTYFAKYKRVKEYMEELKESASKTNLLRQCMGVKFICQI